MTVVQDESSTVAEKEKHNGNADVDDYDKTKFDHKFSGWSVWIEPELSDEFYEMMKKLQKECGGKHVGVHSFVPHVTILYNIQPRDDGDGDVDPEKYLKNCWEQYQETNQQSCKNNQIQIGRDSSSDTRPEGGTTPTIDGQDMPRMNPQHNKNKNEDKNSDNNSSDINNNSEYNISMYDWYYHHYPKSADNGKGFGCSIALLLVRPSDWLESLYDTCQGMLGVGERKNFIPHLSLVYAPEIKETYLQGFIKDQQRKETLLHQPMRIKYLSLWSTQGPIDEWYCITRIPI